MRKYFWPAVHLVYRMSDSYLDMVNVIIVLNLFVFQSDPVLETVISPDIDDF